MPLSNNAACIPKATLAACACLLACCLPCQPAGAEEPQPAYTFVEADDALLADFLAVVADNVAALPEDTTDLMKWALEQPLGGSQDYAPLYTDTAPAALTDEQLDALLSRHAGDPRLPQLEYVVRACRGWLYSGARGLDAMSITGNLPASTWQPLLDAYTAGTADAGTLYLLRPYYFTQLERETDRQIEGLPDGLASAQRTETVGGLLAAQEAKQIQLLDAILDTDYENAFYHFALAQYWWNLGETGAALDSISWGLAYPESPWPLPFPLSAIDDCLERGEIPVPPGGLPTTEEERQLALATVGAVCELDFTLGIPFSDIIQIKEMAKEAQLILALSGDGTAAEWLPYMYRIMGQARRADLAAVSVSAVCCGVCSSAMLMYPDNYGYDEREAAKLAFGVSAGISENTGNAAAVLRLYYKDQAWLYYGLGGVLDGLLPYMPDYIDSADPGLQSPINSWLDASHPQERLAATAKARLTELAACQLLREDLERVHYKHWLP